MLGIYTKNEDLFESENSRRVSTWKNSENSPKFPTDRGEECRGDNERRKDWEMWEEQV